MSEEPEMDLREKVGQAFYRMNGLDPIIADIPQGAMRADLVARLSDIFGVDAPSDLSDKKLAQLFTFCRLRLDALADQKRMQSLFVDEVLTAMGEKTSPDPFDKPVGSEREAPAHDPATDTRRKLHDTTEKEDAPTELDHVLFPDARDQAFELPDNYTSLLLPCPEGSDAMTSWLSGEPWAANTIAIGFGRLSLREEEGLAEAEAEMHAGPGDFMRRNGIRRAAPSNDGRAEQWLMASWPCRTEAPTERQSLLALRDAVAAAIETMSPSDASVLARLGARVNPGRDTLGLVARTLRLEAELLEECDLEEERGEQILLGSPSPDRALLPGQALTRAVILHAFSGEPFPDMLAEALAEIRLAQAWRDCDAAGLIVDTENFDRIFFEDCLAPIEQYRFAKNMEAEPAI